MFVPPPPLLTPHFYFPLELFGIFHIPINYLVDNFNKLTQMAVIKQPYIQIQLVYIGSLPKVQKSRVCVPPHPLFGTLLRHCMYTVHAHPMYTVHAHCMYTVHAHPMYTVHAHNI